MFGRLFGGGGSKTNVASTVANETTINNATTTTVDLAVQVNPDINVAVDLSPIEAMGDAIVTAGTANAAAVMASAAAQARSIEAALGTVKEATAGALAASREASKEAAAASSAGQAGIADAIKGAGTLAGAALAIVALWFALRKGDAPGIQIST